MLASLLEKSKKYIILILLLTALVATFISSILVYINLPGSLQKPVVVIINQGVNLRVFAAKLEEDEIIRSAKLFYFVTALGELLNIKIKYGEYNLPDRVTMWQVLTTFIEGKSTIHRITVKEGETVYQVIRALNADPTLIGEIKEMPTEGYLMPDTYFYSYGDQRQKILSKMKMAMSNYLDTKMPYLSPESPIKNRKQLLTLASIVEKEAIYDSEKPIIASVYINRMNQKIRLQADPTTIYGITMGEYVLNRPLNRKDLKQANTYNTYYIKGLPPTPIACPSRSAIDAVINPVVSKYLYFVVSGDGRHNFSTCYSEHRKSIKAYKSRLNNKKNKGSN